MAHVVAITGGIASGKTAALDFLAQRGVPVFDADIYSRQLTAADGTALAPIAAAFGPQYIGPQGLNRAAMRELIFSQPEARKKLEAIIHPLVRQAVETDIAHCSAPWLVLALPLLAPGDLWLNMCSRVLVIDAPEELQIKRLASRSQLSAKQAQAIIAAQISRRDRLTIADDVIENDGTLAELQAALKKVADSYDQLFGAAEHASFEQKHL